MIIMIIIHDFIHFSPVLTGRMTLGVLIRTQSLSSLEEDDTREVDSDDDSDDADYRPRICVR